MRNAGIQLRLVGDDQALRGSDHGCGRLHDHAELAQGRTAVCNRVVGALYQRTRDRGDAIRLKNLCVDPRSRGGVVVTHTYWDLVEDGCVPGIAAAYVLGVDGKGRRIPQVQGCLAALFRNHQIRSDNGHRIRNPPLAWKRFIVHAIDEPPERPLGSVGKHRPWHIRRRII